MKLHHLAIGALDVQQVATFYQSAFELSELQKHQHEDGSLRSIWLQLDDAILMIESAQKTCPQVTGVGAGLFLIAFRVEKERRREVESRLKDLGSPIESRTAATSYARDPEGNRIAISHY